MKRKSTILFDLDGTLVDTEEGITKCVLHALAHYGMPKETQKKLRRFIGPPLEESCQREYGFSEEKAKEAVIVFRERYGTFGVQECRLFPGVEHTLKALKEHGFVLGVASSKPEPFCCQILERFGVGQYFDAICGAQKDGKINTKIQVLEDAFLRLGVVNREDVVLIGDTRYDALGAKEAGIGCLGVSYGFESDLDEMRKAGVTEIFDSLEDVLAYFVGREA